MEVILENLYVSDYFRLLYYAKKHYVKNIFYNINN